MGADETYITVFIDLQRKIQIIIIVNNIMTYASTHIYVMLVKIMNKVCMKQFLEFRT